MKFKFDYWKALDKHIKETYSDKVVFIHDPEVSYFDIDESALIDPVIYLFKSINHFKRWESSDGRDFCDMVSNLSVLWVNGERDEKIIYELRG